MDLKLVFLKKKIRVYNVDDLLHTTNRFCRHEGNTETL